ncbi:MAG TPA: hypothetical protein VNB49_11605 [Candidatus Dormibacteraeota bacterium]|nr:hypothetical protein [Candidatus Dormibacteraeota bacterium]
MDISQLDVQILAARIEKLESANRRSKSASVIALLFVVFLLLLSTRHAERVAAAARADRIEQDVLHARTVEAQDFVLKDADGHVYARLSLSPRVDVKRKGGTYLLPGEGAILGQAALQFYDDKGNVLWTAPSSAQFLPAR